MWRLGKVNEEEALVSGSLLRLNWDILPEPRCCFQEKEESCTALVLSELIRKWVQWGGCGKVRSKILPLAAFTC